jgi:hypothetical protein
MTRPHRFSSVLLAALAAPLFATLTHAQCAMCRASLLNSQGGAELIEGLRQGIILLLAIPLIIAASVLIRLKRAARVSDGSATQQKMQDGESDWQGVPYKFGEDGRTL